MDKADLDALRLAVETQRKRGPAHRNQIDSKLTREPWLEVAEFAAYSCQVEALRLAPWQWPPIWVDDIEAALSEPDTGKRIRSAALLLKRMQALGVSKFHPDPLAAIAQAEAKRPAPAK